MEIIAAVAAFVAGIVGSAFFSRVNAPEVGPILAICVMGAFIMWAIRNPKGK